MVQCTKVSAVSSVRCTDNQTRPDTCTATKLYIPYLHGICIWKWSALLPARCCSFKYMNIETLKSDRCKRKGSGVIQKTNSSLIENTAWPGCRKWYLFLRYRTSPFLVLNTLRKQVTRCHHLTHTHTHTHTHRHTHTHDLCRYHLRLLHW